jgi:predicted nuclease of restriction endonuclease-like (RecB) superfamily
MRKRPTSKKKHSVRRIVPQAEAESKSPSRDDTEGPVALPSGLLDDLREMIEKTRRQVATAVNMASVMLNWNLGQRIWREIMGEKRAAYGEQIVDAVSRQLASEYGRGFSRSNLFHMIRFVQTFPDEKIVSALSRQLSWTHFRSIMYLEDPMQRDFYAEMCRIERWSTRTLQDRIQSMLYERTALSKKPEKLIREELNRLRDEDHLTPDMVFRDPVVLRQLGLAETYSERDLEDAILRQIEMFLREMGSDFAFMERQKQITIEGVDHWIDLLFYHRRLRCLFVVDLKIGRFKAEYKGQIELYLRWLEKNEQQPGENPPLGLILCAGKSTEQIRLLKLDRGRIRVAEYLTELPPRQVLENKLHQAVQIARERFAIRSLEES